MRCDPGGFGAVDVGTLAVEIVQRLGAIAHDDDFVGELALFEGDEGQFQVARIVFDEQDGLERGGLVMRFS